MSRKKKHSEIIVLLDRSGSIKTIASDLEGGMNQYIKDRKRDSGNAKFTFVQFDDKYEIVYDAVPINGIKKLKVEPRGMTALNDAVGKTIANTKERLGKLNRRQRPGKVLFVILTDGLENASTEYTSDQIQSMIKEQTDAGWQFVFLGANQDAFVAGGSIGVLHGNAINFDATGDGVLAAINYTSQQTSQYLRSHDVQTHCFFDGETNASRVGNDTGEVNP